MLALGRREGFGGPTSSGIDGSVEWGEGTAISAAA